MYKYYDKDLNVVETELLFNKKFGLFYRPETSDLEMIREGSGDYPTLKFEGKNVMDCGANIGSFTVRAIKEGAAHVWAYEPEQFNFKVLNHNVRTLGSECVRVTELPLALVGNHEPSISFYLGKSKNSACSGTTNPSSRKMKLTVRATNFADDVEAIKPDLIKFDIEGGEYGILMDYTFPDHVKEIAVELHGMTKEHNELMWILDKKLQEQFPTIHFHKICEVFKKPALILGHYSR